jgi:hypothetical protein
MNGAFKVLGAYRNEIGLEMLKFGELIFFGRDI